MLKQVLADNDMTDIWIPGADLSGEGSVTLIDLLMLKQQLAY